MCLKSVDIGNTTCLKLVDIGNRACLKLVDIGEIWLMISKRRLIFIVKTLIRLRIPGTKYAYKNLFILCANSKHQ